MCVYCGLLSSSGADIFESYILQVILYLKKRSLRSILTDIWSGNSILLCLTDKPHCLNMLLKGLLIYLLNNLLMNWIISVSDHNINKGLRKEKNHFYNRFWNFAFYCFHEKYSHLNHRSYGNVYLCKPQIKAYSIMELEASKKNRTSKQKQKKHIYTVYKHTLRHINLHNTFPASTCIFVMRLSYIIESVYILCSYDTFKTHLKANYENKLTKCHLII